MTQQYLKSNTHDTCDTFCFDEEKVNRIQKRVDEVNGVELLFKALSDSTRIKIAYALTIENELCVCDVANIIGSSTATASHHLRLLRDLGLAKHRKEGKLVFYSLADDHVHQLVSIALIHSKEGGSNGESTRK
ncbi:ArsR/SmtB family transcription factor [Cytobacillus solani]|uniref:ArsR family transcriptional regulator n=1 Tax=Cytobacillus solani TaxID=1637975 RepID=A0A0Q3VFU1_9BACI|nr:metalloregulator ArsR/SmtB family transcription factor [Cytobacillus solani]KQL18171.1 ArsR family transcriptional regulator [Cytobacillus solani]USK56009.1 metalloregulator ArsR/SmtB family transcription factor [Cytobacillus solani]